LLVGKTVVDSATAGCLLTAGGEGIFTNSGAESLTLNRQTSDGIIIGLRKDNTVVGSIGSRSSGANLYIALRTETAGDGCGLTGSDSSTGAILPSDGNGATADNHIDLGAPAVRFKDLYLSGGVYLGGTGAANLLDDYEEGTFTATVIGPTAGTATYSTQIGKYTKIGNVVNILIDLTWTGGTGSGAFLAVTGLPFTIGGSNTSLSGIAANIALSANNIAVFLANISTTTIYIQESPVGGGAGANINYDSAGSVIISGTYFT
jgi:hypothetical protein